MSKTRAARSCGPHRDATCPTGPGRKLRLAAWAALLALLSIFFWAGSAPGQAASRTAKPAARNDDSQSVREPGQQDQKWRTTSGRLGADVLPKAAAAKRAGTDRLTSRPAAAEPQGTAEGAIEPLAPIANSPRRPIALVTQGPGTLPNEAGQLWRNYDISPYTLRVTSTNRPEQAIVDWILRETGYEAWHGEPLGLLSATERTLRVYHTPEMHALVSEVVDRFVDTQAESHAFGLRVVTVGHPNWRAKAQSVLHPVQVQTQGIQAWLVQKEDAALMLAELRKRMDFREHSSPHLLVNNGQSTTVSATRPRAYTRDVALRPEVWPAFEPQLAQFDEGFSLELSPLLSLDGGTIDAVIKCNIDQLEKLVPVMIEVPTPVAPRQRTQIEVPQVTHCRLHERFRWPVDQVLVVGLGVVATPVPAEPAGLLGSLPLLNSPPRADLLVFIESKGRGTGRAAPEGRTSQRDANTYRGRY
ncbi:MAG: hypothetical protein WD847_09230 [Pirellulales bacterium]